MVNGRLRHGAARRSLLRYSPLTSLTVSATIRHLDEEVAMNIKEGDMVQAKGPNDRKWKTARVLWISSYSDFAETDVKAAYLQFKNGTRGVYDDQQMRVIE